MLVESVNVTFIIGLVNLVACCSIRSGVEQDDIVDASHVQNITLFRIAMCAGAFPDDLVAKVLRSKDGIEDDLEVVARRGVAVEVEAAGGLEHPVQLDQTGSHHDEVSQHLVGADEVPQCGDHPADVIWGFLYQVSVDALRRGAPVPGVIEGFDLSVGIGAAFVLEQDVVGAVGVEGRIQIDQVNAGRLDVLPQDGEVVAVIECVLHCVNAFL
ncbi:MAG: hypothetical protein BWY63_03521 [Chloroflexi bacterium ADurb.Bin360]|nr:MAG: hypothetical protein BWY63_03521 [Chloroflexi bacterium ADurb.Bin360]